MYVFADECWFPMAEISKHLEDPLWPIFWHGKLHMAVLDKPPDMYLPFQNRRGNIEPDLWAENGCSGCYGSSNGKWLFRKITVRETWPLFKWKMAVSKWPLFWLLNYYGSFSQGEPLVVFQFAEFTGGLIMSLHHRQQVIFSIFQHKRRIEVMNSLQCRAPKRYKLVYNPI